MSNLYFEIKNEDLKIDFVIGNSVIPISSKSYFNNENIIELEGELEGRLQGKLKKNVSESLITFNDSVILNSIIKNREKSLVCNLRGDSEVKIEINIDSSCFNNFYERK